ncbi:HAD-IA family hydrolase [Candidatus Haliotispira prima]|uniref:HAD-IA family hydrolase n=1 Tax=Candidatus Haliotispira prima TaxID=3034016 RepID=A0ABY8MIN1_9SPIO|nr:HAD-IA family hydrolase [Candidatus Haliotispira prima]
MKALIFDVDGTLAETEELHRRAFNQAFAQLGTKLGVGAWNWDAALYARLLGVTGGKERILSYWAEVSPEIPSDAPDRAREIHKVKTAIYGGLIQDTSLRPGVMALIEEAFSQGQKLAIATTTSPENVDVLLQNNMGSEWRKYFTVVEDASTAAQKKPDPTVYLQAVSRLGLRPSDCLVFEDSAAGLEAALRAGLRHVVVTPGTYTEHHSFSGAMKVLPNLDGVTLTKLADWIAQA